MTAAAGMHQVRNLAKAMILTPNTVRYAVELPRIDEALDRIGPVETLLDAGAGGGHYSEISYARRCAKLYAVENDANNCALLTRAFSAMGGKATAIRGSILDIGLSDGSVDCVTCTQVLEHVADHEEAVGEFGRLLRKGGFLLITVPRPPPPWKELEHVRDGYTLENLNALVLPRGFELVHTDYCLTTATQRIMKIVQACRGYFPRVLPFRELTMTTEERRASNPYVLLCLFRKGHD